uniref:Uncharacterized protein n=1 Tax=Anguilla anguilla TaxID=7936 RepID=A0A0E9W1C8_ANGAN
MVMLCQACTAAIFSSCFFTLTLYSLFHFKCNVPEYRAQATKIVSLSKYLCATLHVYIFFPFLISCSAK